LVVKKRWYIGESPVGCSLSKVVIGPREKLNHFYHELLRQIPSHYKQIKDKRDTIMGEKKSQPRNLKGI
jgi:hypothetical protein